MDVMQYAELFQAEAGEYMQVLNRCLLNLEKDPGDREELQEAFRVAHSLKGMAGTMGYQHVTDIAHGLENFMEDFKSFEKEPSPEVIDLLFEAVDLLQGSLDHPEASTEQDRQNWDALLLKMEKTRDVKDRAGDGEAPVVVVEETGKLELGPMDLEILRQAREVEKCPCQVDVALKKDVLMKSVRVYMVFKALEELGEIVATNPPRYELEEENFDCFFQVVVVAQNNNLELLHEKTMQISDVERVEVKPWFDAEDTEDHEDEPVESDTAGEKDSALQVPQEQVGPAQGLEAAEKPAAGETGKRESAPSAVPGSEPGQATKAADKMVRVETQKLDDLVNLVGEMVVARTRISELGHGYNDDLDSTIDQLKSAISNLQDTAMELRMVPIDHVFGRFPRMVRDLCREKGKKVQLHISGEETELDRSIINRLSDPLVHLLRNAFDHGIESPQERIKKGKKEEGSIFLKAYHEGNQVIITVEDDGSGIDPEKIGRLAVKKGLINEEEMKQLGKDDLVSLIFFSGFSTSEIVTDVSGRGVGMDAVRNSIEALHGSIEVFSEINVMTRFEMRLPLTLAIITTMLIKSAGQLYAIPVEVIRENVYLGPEEIKSISGNPVVNLRGEVIQLHTLSSLLGFDNGALSKGDCSVVIVEAANRRAGLIVDNLIGQQEIMIKSLGGLLKGLKGIAGATVLGDGTVALIIDVAGLLSEGRELIE